MTQTKRVFITGGASGLGRALALRYARDGWRVCIADLNDERGASTRTELAAAGAVEALYRHADVTSEADLQAIADELARVWGGLDVLINNAGVAQAGAIEDVSLSDWEWILNINLLGVVRGCKVFTPIFKRQGSGHIVNIASMAARCAADVVVQRVESGCRGTEHDLGTRADGRWHRCQCGLPVILPDQSRRDHARHRSWPSQDDEQAARQRQT